MSTSGAPVQPALPPSAQELRDGRARLAEEARSGDVAGYHARCSALMDDYFRLRLKELECPDSVLEAHPFVLVAVGGYGRAELCPGSDIDVLLLFEKEIPAGAAELCRGLFHPLWDLGLDLGQGTRTLKDCVGLSKADTQVLTSLLDTRRITGSEAILSQFHALFAEKVLRGSAASFGSWVLEHNAGRRAQYGDSSGLLEPDLKNGLGGLRDVHQMHWLRRVLSCKALHADHADPFLSEDWAEMERDNLFLLHTRTALHLAAGRKADRLSFDLQPKVADLLGFVGHDTPAAGTDAAMALGLAVEQFLSRLHRAMTRIRAMRQALWVEAFPPRGRERELTPKIHTGPRGVSFRDDGAVLSDPALILELFVQSARTGRPPSWSAQRAVRLALGREDIRAALPALANVMPALVEILAASGRDPETLVPEPQQAQPGGLIPALKGLLAPVKPAQSPKAEKKRPAPPPQAATALQAMLDTGALAALVPEFAPVEHLVQFDDFHIHPVGKHTLEAVRILAAMPQSENPLQARLAKSLSESAGDGHRRFDHLLLAAFCHDLTKPDRDHAESGARLAADILRRLGASEACVADVCFLVRHHLLIPKIATRRDLADESVAAGVAETAETAERLDMLFLLAAADSQATGPRAWNPWTGSLFTELFRKARKLLTDGPLAEPEAVHRAVATREKLRELAKDRFDPAFVDKCLEQMPKRATLILEPETLVRHLDMVRRYRAAMQEDLIRKPSGRGGIGVTEIDAVHLAENRCFQVSIAAPDQPGLFATIAGVLALHDMNILAAEILTWTDGTALDVFIVEEPHEGLYLEDLWQRVRRAVSYALTGKLSLDYRLEQKRSSPLTVKSGAPRRKTSVRLDNEASDFYTILEVAAPDRLGLLYDMARALSSLHVQIHLARIATTVGRIHDVFYVRDAGGQKISDPTYQDEIKKALSHAAKSA